MYTQYILYLMNINQMVMSMDNTFSDTHLIGIAIIWGPPEETRAFMFISIKQFEEWRGFQGHST
jgi:hypothetical protein